MFARLRSLLVFILVQPLILAAAPVSDGPFLKGNCIDCHDADAKKGGLDLTALEWKPAERAIFEKWVKVFDQVKSGEMPPKKKPRPEPAEASTFLGDLEKDLLAADRQRIAANGRTVLRRMNRNEYERTIHDLLGISTPLAALLPGDTPLHGFDTVAEGLRFSTLQMEKYLEAADEAIDDAINLGPAPESSKLRLEIKQEKEVRWILDTPEGGEKKHRHVLLELPDAVVYFQMNYPAAKVKQPKSMPAGMYRIRINGYGYQSAGQSIPMRVYGDNYKEKELLGWFEMPPDQPRVVDFTTFVRAGDHLHIEPTNTGTDDTGKGVYNIPVKEFKGPGLALQWVEIEGPIAPTWPPRGLATLFGDIPVVKLDEAEAKKNPKIAYEIKPQDPNADAKRALEQFAAKAFRRPLEGGEVDRYATLITDSLDKGRPFVEAMRVGFRAVLTAPQFLFFEEQPGKLSEHALASRLSYFLWSSMPDEQLLALATERNLSKPDVLRAQVERMLNDPKAARFVDDFTGQWLDLRNINATSPDEKLYPESDELLRVSMVAETKAYFAEMLKANLPVKAAIDSDFAMLNSRLAEHYQIPNVAGEEMRKVTLPPDSPRGGFITQGSILKITANGTTTSPVQRGGWVMKKILGRSLAPPPAGVGSIEPDTRGATTVREQLAKHRNSETCAACHANIDPPGFALECFDVIGGFREQYRSQGEGKQINLKNSRNKRHYVKLGQPVDASGEFDGKPFVTIKDFKKLLLEKSDEVTTSLAGKLVTYSTGAGINFADRATVDSIAKKTKEQGGGLRALIHEIVQSPLFQSK